MSGGDGGASETDDPTLKIVESVKVKVSGYEHVCYSYGHRIQCKQRKEYAFQVGWMWTVVAVESVLILVMTLVMQLMMQIVMQMVKSEV